MNILMSVHTSPQSPNAPSYSAGNEHQINPGIGHYAGRGIH